MFSTDQLKKWFKDDGNVESGQDSLVSKVRFFITETEPGSRMIVAGRSIGIY